MGLVSKLSGSDMIIIDGETYVHIYRKRARDGKFYWRAHVQAPQDIKIQICNDWTEEMGILGGEEKSSV